MSYKEVKLDYMKIYKNLYENREKYELSVINEECVTGSKVFFKNRK